MARLKALLLAALLGLALPLAAQTDGVCVIVAVDGPAVVSAPGSGQRAAEVGLGLGRNATLRTRPGGRATLACPDRLQVVVGPETAIAVADLVADGPQPFGLRLLDGIAGFLFEGGGDGDGVQVRTPSAVAAVRSTQWAMRVEAGASAVFAREGAVFVLAEDGSVRLGPGDGVDVSAAGEIGAVVRWGQARIDRFADLLGPDW